MKLPMSEFYTVQMVMDADSGARQFAQYTSRQRRQAGRVRPRRRGAGRSAPISQPHQRDSRLQLSGEFTAATAETIARMLREGT